MACCHVLTGFGIILASTWNLIEIVLRHGVAMLGDLEGPVPPLASGKQ